VHLPLVDRLDRWIDRWAVASQQPSRRNAMVAATALTQRRAEAREAQEYVASRAGLRAASDVPPPAAAGT